MSERFTAGHQAVWSCFLLVLLLTRLLAAHSDVGRLFAQGPVSLTASCCARVMAESKVVRRWCRWEWGVSEERPGTLR